MAKQAIDLAREQQATSARPPYGYSTLARAMFAAMDGLTGRADTLAKARLIEAVAPVPYRAWEHRQHSRMALHYADKELVGQYSALVKWAREAHDNEYLHLRIVNEKLREDGIPDPLYMTRPIPLLLVKSYELALWVLSRLSMRRSFLLNGELEDHSEHVYAKLVDEHPEWEDQPVANDIVRQYGSFRSWADVFRRIGLDERDHMNRSFVFGGRPEKVVEYEGMPTPKAAA